LYHKLTDQEIRLALEKIRQKYQILIDKFHKPYTIAKLFEDRFMNALKSKADISVFLLAEIEAVQEIYNQEVEKQKQREEESMTKKINQKSFADKVLEENQKKIIKYPKIDVSPDADEEIERLFGAIRVLILNFWPIINQIYKNEPNYPAKRLISNYYHTLLTKYDYKGEVPIAKSYIIALNMIPKNFKKIDYERNYIIKETAFLLNEMLTEMKKIMNEDALPNPQNKLSFNDSNNKVLKENSHGISYKDGFNKVIEYLSGVILDFRIKDLKKIHNY